MGFHLSKELTPFDDLKPLRTGIRVQWLDQHDALVVSKSCAGFDRATVKAVRDLLRRIEDRQMPNLKFLIFDFAHGGSPVTNTVEGFEEMVVANAELIVDTPVITLAWVRSMLNGLDFDFAMNCSAIVAESPASFSLAGEPFDLFGLYAAVGRRIGFGRTERLIESEAAFSAEEARDLLIVKDVVAPQPGASGISSYLVQFGRRYNASHAIFRAQRMAEPPVDRRPVEGLPERLAARS